MMSVAPVALAPLCPVCRAGGPAHLASIDRREYWSCATCDARFLDPAHYPGPDEERSEYLHHENLVDDPGYRRFLSRLAEPLIERLDVAAGGLDYGCGPGPALAAMLREAGLKVALYDPFFQPDPAVLRQTYAFITCTEVAEHFHTPAEEFERLDGLLRPGGWLAVMTCFQTDDARFANWHYRKDPTHVVFYRESTMHFIARRYGWTCDIPCKDVALMRKP